MSKHIGRRVDLGIGPEITRGTAVTPSYWYPHLDFDFQARIEEQVHEGAMGNIIDAHDAVTVKRWSEGGFGGDVKVNGIGYILRALFGNCSSALNAGESAVWDHTFTVRNSNTYPTYTLVVVDPNAKHEFANVQINEMTIRVTPGEIITFEVTFIGGGEATDTSTVSYVVDYKFVAAHATFKQAATQAGLAAAGATKLKSFEITFSKNVDPSFVTGSITPDDVINKAFAIEGSFEYEYEDETIKDYVVTDDTPRALRLDIVDTDTTIGSSENPELLIDLYKVAFTDWKENVALNEIVTATVSFKGLYSLSDNATVQAVLTNTTSSH